MKVRNENQGKNQHGNKMKKLTKTKLALELKRTENVQLNNEHSRRCKQACEVRAAKEDIEKNGKRRKKRNGNETV